MTWKLWSGPFKTSSVPVARRQAGSARMRRKRRFCCAEDAVALGSCPIRVLLRCFGFIWGQLLSLLFISYAFDLLKKKPKKTIATTILSSSHIKLWTVLFLLLLSLQQMSSVMMWAVCVSFEERSETERALSTHIFSSETCWRCYHGYRWCFAGPFSPFFPLLGLPVCLPLPSAFHFLSSSPILEVDTSIMCYVNMM